ncbi:rab GTPase-activating protein 22-like isoform X2 [Malus sylvestris]|uniref:rab GTPase-activating protein 22-like isoform X2 n=1 Tax=Malus sylvestris TaxID=3752 RepID=UPI0021AC8E2B|nr:rab GTPase-activating protein 22-like isoform X2 [Malus sylvestris]
MITHQKQPMKALRRSHTSSNPPPPSNSTSSPSSNSTSSPSSNSTSSPSPSSSWIHLRSVLLVVASSSSTPVSTDRGSLKSPWSRRRKKHALLPKQWKSLFTPDGKLTDGGLKFLKKVRSGGVDPSIRAEVWPFLLGVYDVNSSKEERETVKKQNRKEYENLRRQCWRILTQSDKSLKLKETSGNSSTEGSGDFSQVLDCFDQGDVTSARKSISTEGGNQLPKDSDNPVGNQAVQTSESLEADGEKSGVTCEDPYAAYTESTDSDSSEESDITRPLLSTDVTEENYVDDKTKESSSPSNIENKPKVHSAEDFATWQKIIRLDAVRANDEWIIYSPSQADVSEIKARGLAESVGLKDYDHLEPCRIFHASRLVGILEAYALYDPEIGYCQGMSDLLSPIISVVEEDHEAFWCFVGFMKKARHNFRLDEAGIRRQLGLVSKIIKCKDVPLYKHLEKLQAEDCFFVYRMVVVLFRRELSFEDTLCLWEVMWADQAAVRVGIAKSAWGRIRQRAPPTDDLLLYAIAACVLQRRKTIIEKYSSMEEIMRECNSMAGRLDVWKLLDDAHDLVVTLHDKV